MLGKLLQTLSRAAGSDTKEVKNCTGLGLPRFKYDAVNACNSYLNKCYEAYGSEPFLVRLLVRLILFIKGRYTEYDLVHGFKEKLVCCETIERTYDLVATYKNKGSEEAGSLFQNLLIRTAHSEINGKCVNTDNYFEGGANTPDENNNTEAICENAADVYRIHGKAESSEPVFKEENGIDKLDSSACSGGLTTEDSNFQKEEKKDVPGENKQTDSSEPVFKENHDICKMDGRAGSDGITIKGISLQEEAKMDAPYENNNIETRRASEADIHRTDSKIDSSVHVQPAFKKENDIYMADIRTSSDDRTIKGISLQKEAKMDAPYENNNTETRRESAADIHRIGRKTDSSTHVQPVFKDENDYMVDSQAVSGGIIIKDLDFQKEEKRVGQTSGTINWIGKDISLKGSCASLSYLHSRKQQNQLLLPCIIQKGAMQGQMVAAIFSGINGDEHIAGYMKKKFSDDSSEASLCNIKPEYLDSEGRLKTRFFDLQGGCLKEKEHIKEKNKTIDYNQWSLSFGSTMSLLNITPEGKLHISTLGDSRIMLFQDGKCKFTSFDMSVSDCMAASSLVCNIVPEINVNRLYAVDFTKNRESLIETVAKGITGENSKYFTDRYGEIPPVVLAELCISHIERRRDMVAAGASIVKNSGSYQLSGTGVDIDPDTNKSRRDGGVCYTYVCSAWGLKGVFLEDDVKRFHPVVRTIDLSVLDENKPIQIVIGPRIFTESFDDDIGKIGKAISNSQQKELPEKVQSMVQFSLNSREEKKLDRRKNMAVTVMELNIKKHKK